MPRACARVFALGQRVRADTRRLRWLDEEDREKDVPGHWRTGHRRRRSPCVTHHERGDISRQHDPGAENRRCNGGGKRWTGLAGIAALGCRATTVVFRLCWNAMLPGAVRIDHVHRALGVFNTARHACFRRWHPPGADRGVSSHQAERQRESRESMDEHQHVPRMLASRGRCQTR